MSAIGAVTGHQGDASRGTAIRHRQADRRRAAKASGQTTDHFDFDAGSAQRIGLFAAAPENKRIAALEPHHASATPRLADHQFVDEVLLGRWAAAALAHMQHARIPARQGEHARIHEVVAKNHVGRFDAAHGAHGQQFRIPGAGADKTNGNIVVVLHALTSSPC